MATKNNIANDNYRNDFLLKLMEFCKSEDGGQQEVLRTANNKFCFPFVNSEQSDEFLEITVSVPKGSRDGEPYDGYERAQEFEIKLQKKLEREEKAKKAKEKKIAFDKKKREIAKKHKEQGTE